MSILSSLSNFFLEPIFLYALLLLIPFLLLYFIRPKPKHKVIPSLMFLFKDMGRNKRTNFFRRLVQDLLFLLQLLILLLLLIAVAKPYINVAKESLFKNTVLVVDVSASMKADFEGKTRFDKAVDLAKENLGTINTLVLAKKTPEAVLVDEGGGNVKDYLNRLKPTDTPTNLYDAISTAGGYTKANSRVVVISDFIDTETDTSLDTAKKTLEAQGIKVDFIRVFEKVNNVGIVDLDLDEKKTVAVIKNFNQEGVEVKVKVNTLEETINIPANSQELFSFSTPPGTSKLELDVTSIRDGLKADNTVYISAPEDVKRKVLLITNNNFPEKTFLYNAFAVMNNVLIDVAIPPKIPELDPYDIYILKDLDPNLILPGSFKSIKEVVEQGKTVIVTAQTTPTTMLNVDFYGLMPVKINETVTSDTNVLASSSESLTANIEFGIIKKYFKASPLEGVPIIVIAATQEDIPLITFNPRGQGKMFYYGLLDEDKIDKQAVSEFAKSPAYFVFWKRVVDFATDTPSIKNLNYWTGSILNFKEEQRIQTPTGIITTDSLSLDNAGLYTLNDRMIAISLLNEKESDVNNDESFEEQGTYQPSAKFKEKVPFELTDYLIIAAIILLLLEFIYIKLRGDL